MLRLSTSSWSLDKTLGSPRYPHGLPDTVDTPTNTPDADALSLLELPAHLAEHGINTLELSHFHLPSREPEDLKPFRTALDQANVELFSILIDAGDITQDDGAALERDVHWISSWLDTASQLGARHARVIAGRAEPAEAIIARSAHHLRVLADYAESINLKLITENWYETASQPETLLEILRQCDNRVGLCVDFGNADSEGRDKYRTLEVLLPHATSIHAKPRVDAVRQVDRDDLLQCMNLAVAANFTGPISIINTQRDNEWARLDELRDLLNTYLGQRA
ncbi:sugar phosphate isomerase/epimerase family protein [Phycisphaerales bacterium AB-hyl4]|uniref:Sugar phosphate isomerase/epimerase family protein n=1 Tax=Natronomicrosphaera hydrolytica TaxID=3242702 RepID=A0ABV4U9J5_9BACT